MSRLVPAAVLGSIPITRIIAGSRIEPSIRPTAPPTSPTPRPIPDPASPFAVLKDNDGSAAAAPPAPLPPGAPSLRNFCSSSTPCQKTRTPTATTSTASGAQRLAKPPMKAPTMLGMPMTAASRHATRPSCRCRIEPRSALEVLTMMFVPPASEGAAPRSSSAGRRIVPRASPTKPPKDAHGERDHSEQGGLPQQDVRWEAVCVERYIHGLPTLGGSAAGYCAAQVRQVGLRWRQVAVASAIESRSGLLHQPWRKQRPQPHLELQRRLVLLTEHASALRHAQEAVVYLEGLHDTGVAVRRPERPAHPAPPQALRQQIEEQPGGVPKGVTPLYNRLPRSLRVLVSPPPPASGRPAPGRTAPQRRRL